MFGRKKKKKEEAAVSTEVKDTTNSKIIDPEDTKTAVEMGTQVAVSNGTENATAESSAESSEVVVASAPRKKSKKKKKDEEVEVPLTWREGRALKKAKYDKIASKFNTAFVLKNKKTGQVAEVRAASSFHACNIIGWKPNKVKVIETKVIMPTEEEVAKQKDGPANTISSQSDVITQELPPGMK